MVRTRLRSRVKHESEDLSADQLGLLDRVAGIMVGGEATEDDLHRLYGHDEFRVPSVVTSYSPAADAPLHISFSR
jgi:hypothetical protein